MPKEMIYRDYLKVDPGDRHTAVRIGWEKDVGLTATGVQLVVVEDEDAGDEMTKQLSALSIDLTRTMINRMIQVLRTARDQAYGKDE